MKEKGCNDENSSFPLKCSTLLNEILNHKRVKNTIRVNSLFDTSKNSPKVTASLKTYALIGQLKSYELSGELDPKHLLHRIIRLILASQSNKIC